MRDDEPPAAPEPALPDEPQTSVHEQRVPPAPANSPAEDDAPADTPAADIEP